MGHINPDPPPIHAAQDLNKLESLRSHPAEWGSFIHHGWTVLKATGHLPSSPLWSYLVYRRDLDPGRFDLNHPRLGKIFRYEADHPPLPPVVPPVVPPIPPIVVASVPEPAAWKLMGSAAGILVVIGSVMAWVAKLTG